MLSFVLFLEKIIESGNAHFREELEGHRPYSSRENDDKEVSDGTRYELVTEERYERLRESRLDSEDYAKTYCKLDYLCQRFDGGIEKQKDTDAQIRILGMLIQSVMWAESKKLTIVQRHEAMLSHGFQ